MCGFGGDLLAIVWDGDVQRVPRRRAARRRARRSTSVRDQSRRRRRCPRSVRTRCTVPGAVDGWFTLLERCGTRSFGEVSAAARCTTPKTASRSPSAARGSSRATRSRYEHFGLHDFHERVRRRSRPAIVGAPARLGAHDPQLLADDGPDAYYRGPIGAAIAERLQRAGGFMTAADVAAHTGAWVEPLRGDGPRRRDPRDAAADAGRHRARGAADRRRPRPRRRRPGSPAPADRGDEARARRPRRVPRRSRRDDDRPATRCSPTTGSPTGAAASIRRARRRSRRGSTPDGGTIYMSAADRDGMLVSLIQSNFFGAGCGLRVDEWGINLHNRGSAFNLDDAHPNAHRPGQDAAAHADPRRWRCATAGRGSCSAARAATGRRRPTLQLLVAHARRRRRPAGARSARRASRSIPRPARVTIEDHFDPAWIDDLRGRGHDIDVVRGYRHGPGHRPRDRVPRAGGYRAGSDPRAEGGVAGL